MGLLARVVDVTCAGMVFFGPFVHAVVAQAAAMLIFRPTAKGPYLCDVRRVTRDRR